MRGEAKGAGPHVTKPDICVETALVPFISVIIPCLNRKDWLREQLAALRGQTYPPDRYEIIVVDNGSVDGTWEWLLEQTLVGPVELRCLRNESSFRTHAGSRNVGISVARGDLIGFTDSDCIVSPEWLTSAAAHFRPGLGIVAGRTIPPDDQDIRLLSRIKTVDDETFFDTCNIFYRREAILRVGGFATDVPRFPFDICGEDTDLGLRVKREGYESMFAADVVTTHRIRHQTFLQWLVEPRNVASVPFLVKKHPSVRKDMLFLRYFLTPATALFDLALVCLILALVWSPWFLAGALPFAIWKTTHGSDHLPPLARPLRIFGGAARGAVIFGILVYTSIRHRAVVL